RRQPVRQGQETGRADRGTAGVSARRALTAVTLLCAVALTGCGNKVEGNAQPVGSGGGGESINTDFDKLLRECEVVAKDKIGVIVGDAKSVSPAFSGAVCMWSISDAPGGEAMATLNWYEMGTLNNEKTTNDKLGYLTGDITVQGR